MEDAPHAALQAWRTLHAPLILATAEGRELQEQADQLRMTRAEQSALREDAKAVAEALRRADDISEPETAEVVTQAAEAIGQGRHPERGTVFGIATIKNTAIVLVGAAVVAAPTALVGGLVGVGLTMAAWETAKHTPFYVAALKALGADMHQLIERGGPEAERLIHRLAPFRAFVRANQEPLRRIAGSTPQLRWMTAYVDFVVRTDTDQGGGPADSVSGTSGPTKPAPAKPDWATAAGTDQYGTYADIDFHGGRGVVVTQRLRLILPGSFMMGSPEDEPGRWDAEGPLHAVTLRQGFWLFDTPCTQALWRAVMGRNPSRFKSPTRPVENVSSADVQSFLRRLNDRVPGLNLVLPSEARWEYACRAGTTEATYAGPMKILGQHNAPVLDAIAWYGGNSGVDFELKNGWDSGDWPDKQYPRERAGTHPVATKAANAWGLYDMLGNVWEWCADHWHASYDGAPNDGSAWLDADADAGAAARVIRGGAWYGGARGVRAADRDRGGPAGRGGALGFRCARVQD
jgi:formylglycine-generating enzyme required for sulfatase activity